MSFPLALITPQIGSHSETFIRRHANDLLPGRTIVVTNACIRGDDCAWHCDAPTMALTELGRAPFSGRLWNSLLLPLGATPWNSLSPVEKFLKRSGVEAVLSEYLDLSLQWLPLARKLGLRFYAHGHGYDVSMKLRDPRVQENYRLLNEANGIIVVNSLARERLIDIGIRPEIIHIIPCGTDIPEEVPNRSHSSAVRCIAIGRMVPKKAPIILLDAFRRALSRQPDMHLDYIGDGMLFDAARQYVDVHGMSDSVTLHRSQEHHIVQQMLRNADIFLQHSRVDPDSGDEEGLPVALLEAMANALPVVSTRHAGIVEAVEDGREGFLVTEGDSKAMASRIAELANDEELRRRLGRAGWLKCRQQFSWENERTQLQRLMKL